MKKEYRKMASDATLLPIDTSPTSCPRPLKSVSRRVNLRVGTEGDCGWYRRAF